MNEFDYDENPLRNAGYWIQVYLMHEDKDAVREYIKEAEEYLQKIKDFLDQE